jgi:peptidoglycan/LPS O-acetylase OafA/YrhL
MLGFLSWTNRLYSGVSSQDPEGLELGELISHANQASTSRSEFIHRLMRNILFELLPSFIQNRIRTPTSTRKLHKTSFLDGLRGMAALIVFIYHTIRRDAGWLFPAYGLGDVRCITQLPFLRVLYSGPAMVHIFFVISGYVLSAKQVKFIRVGNFEKLSDSLFSSIIRRPFRLFLPSIGGLLIFEYTIIKGLNPGLPRAFVKRVELLLFSWRWDFPEYFLKQLWTIPIEFSGSMILFLAIIGLSRARTSVRIFALLILMIHSLASGHWAPCEFFGGFLIAEVEAELEENNDRSNRRALKHNSLEYLARPINNIFWSIALIFGLLIAGWDHLDPSNDPVVGFLHQLTPQIYFENGPDIIPCFWFAFSSILIVWSLFRIPILQKPFVTGPVQYLGDSSYSIYIIHGMFPSTWQERIRIFTVNTIGGTTATTGFITFAFEMVILYLLNAWASELFMRFVDLKSVKFARRIESFCREKT